VAGKPPADQWRVSQERAALPKDKQYAEGWTDGFRQCQAMLENKDREEYRNEHWDERERAWQQQKDQDAGRAYRSQ
jgi:hypothetical protein